MRCSVAELLVRFSATELAEWQIFGEKFEPFGDEWRGLAQIAQMIHNMNVAKGDQLPIEAFMPIAPSTLELDDDEEDEPQSDAEIEAIYSQVYGAVNHGNH